MSLSDGELVELLHDTADAVAGALGGLDDWGLAGTRAGQHHSDLAADAAALAVLRRAPVGVLSEESGFHGAGLARMGAGGDGDPAGGCTGGGQTGDGDGVVVVVDPLDGSTNAARGIPWYAISLCAVDGAGPRAALVVDVPRQRRFQAVRGDGATVDGVPLRPSGCQELGRAVVGLSGLPPDGVRRPGWRQFRALGAQALDLCAVAEGVLDGYLDCSPSAHGPWDYLGGLLVCREAGAVAGDAHDRDLVVLDHDARRTPIAAATAALHRALVDARRQWPA
jgi:myo-inositol-1(or 4)-monophosphatase